MKYQYGQEKATKFYRNSFPFLKIKNIHFYIEMDVLDKRNYIIPPIPPMPMPPMSGIAGAFGSGLSATTASVVKNIAQQMLRFEVQNELL